MIVNHFNNNTNFLHNKSYYYEFLKNKTSIVIQYYRKTSTKTITDNNYLKIKDILNFIFYSYYLRQLGIEISKFEDKCITIKYLDYELKLYIYPYDYDRTIRNLKFECGEYSVNEKIEKYLILFMDENWDLIIYFIDSNETDNYPEEDKLIQNSLGGALN